MFDGLRERMRRRPWSFRLEARLLVIYHRIRALRLSRLSDEEFAQRSHLRTTGKPLDLESPRTYDERQWWLKINYRNPLMTQCSDKVGVRDYVRSKGLEHLLIPLLGVYEDPEDINWHELPDRFYLKTNNSSATNIRCNDITTFDKNHATKLLRTYLKRNHFQLSREWNYIDIPPRIMAEPILESSKESGLVDYRFHCSFGKCGGIVTTVDTADDLGNHRDDSLRNMYDTNWNLLDVRFNGPQVLDRPIDKPAALQAMVRYAEMLSEPFPYCRVDFYNPEGDEVFIGEITFFNKGGNNNIDPEEFQFTMGSWIDLSKINPSELASK